MRSPQPAEPLPRIRALFTQLWSFALRRATDLAELTPPRTSQEDGSGPRTAEDDPRSSPEVP